LTAVHCTHCQCFCYKLGQQQGYQKPRLFYFFEVLKGFKNVFLSFNVRKGRDTYFTTQEEYPMHHSPCRIVFVEFDLRYKNSPTNKNEIFKKLF